MPVRDDLDTDGFAVVPEVFRQDDLSPVIRSLSERAAEIAGHYARSGNAYAFRNVLTRIRETQWLARDPKIRDLATLCLGGEPILVRAILFDKITTANWQLKWHQDRMIPVRRRVETPGYTSWSTKEGVIHTQPPESVLQAMVSLRIHLDDCGEENGPMRVLPGSHASGKLSQAELADWLLRISPVPCLGPAGTVIAFRPLLVHSSQRAFAPGHRRVLHLEFAATNLPKPLEWHDPFNDADTPLL